MDFILKYAMQYVMLENIDFFLSWSLGIFVRALLLELGLTKIPGDHETLSIINHVGLHVDFSSMKSSLGL